MYQVLIIDEDPGFLAITKIFLEHSGSIFADTVMTVADAQDMLSCGMYDAVIFGRLQDSVRDGSAVRALRECGGPMPVILLVEEYQAEEGVLALKQGISHVIVRTIDPKEQFHELISAIRDQVSRSREEVAFQSHDTILSLVTRSAHRFLTTRVNPDEISALFASFGEATGIARAGLVSLGDCETDGYDPQIVAKWHADGVDSDFVMPDPDQPHWQEGRVLSRIRDDICCGHNFISSTREFSSEELEEANFSGVSSILAFPVVTGDEIWGAIVLVDAKKGRYWSDIEIEAIQVMADIIGAGLYSERQKDRVRFLSGMIQQVSDAVIAFTTDRRIVYANAAAGYLLKKDTDVLIGEDIATVFSGMDGTATGGSTLAIPDISTIRAADGSEVVVDVNVTVLWSGDYAGLSVAVLRDATERIRHQQMQSEAFARVDENIRMMEKMGEHIRDPLMIILGHAEMVGGKDGEIILSQVREIQEHVEVLDSEQLKSSFYRKLLRQWYADGMPGGHREEDE